jgi:hypothetical protein
MSDFPFPLPAWRVAEFLCGEPGDSVKLQGHMQTLRNHVGAIVLVASGVLGIVLVAVPLWLRWELDHGITVAIGTALCDTGRVTRAT